MIAPIYEKISIEFPELTFLKVDIDNNPDAAADAGIRSVPTFQFMSGEKKIAEFAGADESLLRDSVQNLQNS